jgi:hypothetical protein
MHPLLLLSLTLAPLYPAYYLYDRLSFVGTFRLKFKSISTQYQATEYFTIPMAQVEDLVYHTSSGMIFATGQGNASARAGWWPPWANFDVSSDAQNADGGIWMIDPQVSRVKSSVPSCLERADVQTWAYERLEIKGMDWPFVTHGIDIWSDPTTPNEVYLHAVNHIPIIKDGLPQPHSDSRIEVFRINLLSEKKIAQHVQTLKHPLVYTPNDIYSLGPFDVLVTNDHVNTRGLLRTAEDLLTFAWTSRTSIVRLTNQRAEVLVDGLHNANGLGHGPNGSVVLGDASGGDLTIFNLNNLTSSIPGGSQLTRQDYLALGIQLDNPTYFSDPYATAKEDASGYVLGGLLSGIHLDKTCRDPYARVPSSVWMAKRDEGTGNMRKRKLLEDDGEWVSGASIGLIVPIAPEVGRKEGWLVVTGPFSLQIGVVRISLDNIW